MVNSFLRKYDPVSSLYKGEDTLIIFNNLRPVMTLRKGVYHRENQKIHREFKCLFKADHSWPWTVPLKVSSPVPIAFVVGRLVLHWGHKRAIMCNYGGLRHQVHEKSSLQVICNYKRSSCSRHVSDVSGKPKKYIKQLLG